MLAILLGCVSQAKYDGSPVGLCKAGVWSRSYRQPRAHCLGAGESLELMVHSLLERFGLIEQFQQSVRLYKSTLVEVFIGSQELIALERVNSLSWSC